MGVFILHQLVSQASLPKFRIACDALVTTIAYAWGLNSANAILVQRG